MIYANVYEAIEAALSVEGYEAPVRTIDPSSLDGEVFNHGSRPGSDMTRMDWVAHNGMTHALIIRAMGGREKAQYLALVNRYCYDPLTRINARKAIMPHLPGKLEGLKREAVIAMWSGVPGITYAMIDCGEGTKTSTLQGHINEVRRELDRLHKAATDHLSKVLADAGLLREEEVA